MDIQEKLFSLRDENYAAFSAKLIPTVPADRFIGVRSPQLRALAKELLPSGSRPLPAEEECQRHSGQSLERWLGVRQDGVGNFLTALPHFYHEENMLHAYLLCIARDYATVVEETERFLPYIDNWAVCDSLAPRTFARHKAELLPRIRKWMAAEHEYTVRFGIGTLMRHFLDADFQAEHLQCVAAIDREEYYIRMMQAWYFATALAKQWAATFPLLSSPSALHPWVRQKTIQKALESYRVSDDHKAILRTLR